eukprot:187449_1
METATILTKRSLNELHARQLSDGKTNIHNTVELVNILGGIDKILTDQLTNPSLYLSKTQLSQISHIFTTPEKDQKQNKLRLISTIDKQSNSITKRSLKTLFISQKNKFGYSLVKSDNWISALFKETTTANILYILNSKVITIFAAVMAITYLILIMIGVYTTGFTIFKILCTLVLIPYLIFTILSVNKTGLKLIIGSFEFWLKIVYSILYNVAICIEYYVIEKEQWTAYNNIELQIFESICFAIAMTLGLGCISLFDAVKLKSTWKIIFCVVVACIATLWVIGLSVKLYTNAEDTSIIHIGFGIGVSISSITISTIRIICIFAWKQAILICMQYIYGTINRCCILYYNPYVQWIDDDNEDDVQYAIGIDRITSTISIITGDEEILTATPTPTNQIELV